MSRHDTSAPPRLPHRRGAPPPPLRRHEISHLLASAFDSAPVAMTITTDTGELLQVNDALSDLLGYAPAALVGRRLEDFAAPDAAPTLSAGRQQVIAAGRGRHVTGGELLHADGHPVPVSLACARVPPSADRGGYLIVHVQDVSEQQTTEVELTRRSLLDPLTGLPNRVLLLDRLTRALRRLERHPSTIAVLFTDLNGFKAVNDTYGHATGDEVLMMVAHRLQLLQRPSDTTCRLGGDEFVVLCEDSGPTQADRVAERIQAALAAPIRCGGGQLDRDRPDLTVTASVGIATTSDPATTAHQLLHDADSAMYRAKPR